MQPPSENFAPMSTYTWTSTDFYIRKYFEIKLALHMLPCPEFSLILFSRQVSQPTICIYIRNPLLLTLRQTVLSQRSQQGISVCDCAEQSVLGTEWRPFIWRECGAHKTSERGNLFAFPQSISGTEGTLAQCNVRVRSVPLFPGFSPN